MLSVTSDYVVSTGCPEPYLRAIAEAGFSHVHWCHEWNTDRLYTADEVAQIARWLKQFGLGVTDLHASAGAERRWGAPRPDVRQAGEGLVINRIDMAAELGTDVIIHHLPDRAGAGAAGDAPAYWDGVWASLDVLTAAACGRGVRIALENGRFDDLERVFARYGPEAIGLCYDAGHGNLIPDGLDRLAALAGRLISIHLHDNDGAADQHRLPFTGTVDWRRLTGILARSSYAKWPNLESTMAHYPGRDERDFLAEAFVAATRLADMIAAARDDE